MRATGPSVAAITFLFTAHASTASATQFSFDPALDVNPSDADFSLPAALIAIASVVDGLLILLERSKALGIWFSNSEKLRWSAKRAAFSS